MKKKKTKKYRDPNTEAACHSIRSMFRIYRLKEEDLCIISAALRRYINDFYRTSPRILRGISERDYFGKLVTDRDIQKFEKRILSGNSINASFISKVIIMQTGGKVTSLHNYICGYIAGRVMNNYPLSDDIYRKLKKELTNSLIKENEVSRVADRIAADYNKYERLDNIRKNENYLRFHDFLEREAHSTEETNRIAQLARELILSEMPANIIDMYPTARSIKRRFIIHIGPTNSGKTYAALQAYKNAVRGVYLAPLRLLAYEIFEQMNTEGIPCSMLTGEEEIDIPFSRHFSSTVEMADLNTYYDVAVIDECQMLSDEQRGGAWTEAIMGIAAGEIHLCASENAIDTLISLIDMCGDTYSVERLERCVPLLPDRESFTFPQSVKKNDALIVFSKRSVLKYAGQLKEYGINASVIYGDLPYDVRRNEVERFVRGETSVVVSTDAIGMGLNLPVERVVFLEHKKFDGKHKRNITADEIRQIAGRAGRMGKFPVGYYSSAVDAEWLFKKINAVTRSDGKVRLRFPKSILRVDMPLSEIMWSWSNIPYDKEMFSSADMGREIMLCRHAEKYTDDKLLIFEFVTIPFNENKTRLFELWDLLLVSEVGNSACPDIDRLLAFSEKDSLEELELLYRKSDLIYYYISRFRREKLPEIIRLKHSISEAIMNRLENRSGTAVTM